MTDEELVRRGLSCGRGSCRDLESGAATHCPAHLDRTPSLSVTTTPSGKLLVHCHASCSQDTVVAALKSQGLWPSLPNLEPSVTSERSRIVATYDYVDEAGDLLFQVVRREPKSFSQRRPDGRGGWTYKLGEIRRVLYRLPRVIAAVDSGQTIYIAEGERDVATIEAEGGVATTNPGGAGNWRSAYNQVFQGADVVIVSDRDAVGRNHARAVLQELATIANSVRIVEAREGKDSTDHFAAGYKLDQFVLIDDQEGGKSELVLAGTHATFARWLGEGYDLDALDAAMATVAVERLNGDPVWLLLVGSPGSAKTETVTALGGAGAVVTSTISSEGALLSATAKRERSSDATGGLLRAIGEQGTLVIKDVTSILQMNRDSRGGVLAALREIYDGFWSRNVGVDGGRTIEWRGRIAVIGAVTDAWDQAHSVISSMGDRFVCIRIDSSVGRLQAGQQALANTGSEKLMRAELSTAVGAALSSMDIDTSPSLAASEMDALLAAADLVTRARTSVEIDQRGNVVDAHAPELPTRFAKQLAQLARGGIAIGMSRTDGLRLGLRAARDSIPPPRLAVLQDIALHPVSSAADVGGRLQKPRTTVDRTLQALQLLGLVEFVVVDEVSAGGKTRTTSGYSLAAGLSLAVLDFEAREECPDLSPHEGSDE